MQRRIFLQNSLLTFGAIAFGKQQIMAALAVEPWKITMLSDTLGIFTEKGGTIAFYISKDGITVVDAQFPDSAAHLVAELKKRNDQPFHLLINTHHHGDHTSGNIVFKDLVGRVLAHENSLKNQRAVAEAQKSVDKQLFPTQIFTTTHNEEAGNEKIDLHYFGAGHTDGDAVIHFQNNNVAHVGDLVFNRRHPFIDRSAGANIKSWIKVLNDTVKKFDKKTVYVFGHAGDGYDVTGNSDALLLFHDYLGNLLKVVDTEIKSGRTKEEILKITEIPGSPQWKGDGIQRGLTAAFEELSATV
ncbi:MAG: MBL fold metallo-hydrolase [Ginsengibacter sp.]